MAELLTDDSGEALFDLELSPFTSDDLTVVQVNGTETISQPFEMNVTVVPAEGIQLEDEELLHRSAVLTFHMKEEERLLHGIVAEVERIDGTGTSGKAWYTIRIVPKLSRLGIRKGSRIFQGDEQTVPAIVEKLLREAGIRFRWALSREYTVRPYVVQYQETELAFVSRLLAEEGIFYRFEHGPKGASMVLGDSPSAHADVPGETIVPFRESAGMTGTEHVSSFRFKRRVRPTRVTLGDFDYLQPMSSLLTDTGEDDLEVYEFPGRYDDKRAGQALARVRLEELRLSSEMAFGTSSARQFQAGTVFRLTRHPDPGLDGEYLIVSVSHDGWQPEVFAASARPGRADRPRYQNTFTCVRRSVEYRPPRMPAPFVPGYETAMVVGPEGEEIFTDEYGRVKVQFHWDREGRRNDRSSCWVRVSQAWAGAGWGALYLPRVGQEVVIEYQNGDPDRPLVVASVYNGQNLPPIPLPVSKTQSTIRSASSPGSDGSNELRFEDAKGLEQIYLHAERDLDIVVENDKQQRVGGNETLTVERDRTKTIDGNQLLTVGLDDGSTVKGDQSLDVSGSRTTVVMGNHLETIVGDQSETVNGTHSLSVALAATESIGLGKRLDVGAAYAVTVGLEMNELVGAMKSEEVLGDKMEWVGGKNKEQTVGSRSETVGGDLHVEVDGARSLRVDKDLVLNVGGSLHHSAGRDYKLRSREMIVSAEDGFVLKVGSATIEVTKNGDVVIAGAKIQVTAKADLTLEGSKISEN